MTALAMKTETKQMIDEMTDEHVALVFAYAKNFVSESASGKYTSEKMAAFERLDRMIRPAPADFDAEKELMEALDEKYGSAS